MQAASVPDASTARPTAQVGADLPRTERPADVDGEAALHSLLEGWFRDADGRLHRADSDG
jgi:hypothetical protein